MSSNTLSNSGLNVVVRILFLFSRDDLTQPFLVSDVLLNLKLSVEFLISGRVIRISIGLRG